MAQNNNDKRAAHREKSDRNMNRAVILLTAGLVAEWYLLMVDRYYARGTISQVVGWYDFLGVMRWAALAVFAAGVGLLLLRARKAWFMRAGGILAAVGGFFAFTSFAMRHFYPISVTVMCVLVPVLLILGIVYLFYQAEFSVQATALAMGLGALVLLGRSGTTAVKACAILAILGICALIVCTAVLRRNSGVLTFRGKKQRVFEANTDYRLTLGVPGLCLALVAAALVVPSVAFYATWALGVAAFALAVYYTIKLM